MCGYSKIYTELEIIHKYGEVHKMVCKSKIPIFDKNFIDYSNNRLK